MVLEKTLESPLDCKEIQPVHSEGDQPWDFFGRESYDKTRQHIKKQRHYFAKKRLSSKSYDFSTSHVWMLRVGL